MSKIIYRVEHRKTWIGPYQHYCARIPHEIGILDCLKHCNKDSFNFPNGSWFPGIRFGFSSKRKLNKWFPAHTRHALHNLEYVVGVYKSSTIISSSNQSCFQSVTAKRIGEYALS